MPHEDILKEHYKRQRLAGLNLPIKTSKPDKTESDEDPIKTHLARRYETLQKYIKKK